jgi:hypothetical protein
MSSEIKGLPNRRTAIRYGLGFLGGLALAMQSETSAFAQATLNSKAAKIGIAGYPGPEIPEGPTSIFQDIFAEGGSEVLPWGSMMMVRETLLDPNTPKSIETPTPKADLFTERLTAPHVIQAAPLSLVVVRMSLEGNGAGIFHGLPSDRGIDTSNLTLPMIEARKGGRELWALVRKGPDLGKPPIYEEQIDELPEGPKDVHFGMLFTDSGNTFLPMRADGALSKIVELPSATAEVGEESILIGYRFGKTQATVTGIATAYPQTK